MQERSMTPDYSISDSSPTCSENMDEHNDDLPNESWSGTSIHDIYHHNSPWNYYCPPLSPSRHHTVLFEMPITFKDPPRPHITPNTCHWNINHVRMPFSPKNLFPNKENTEVKPRWDIIQCALLRPIKNSHELQEAIFTYNLRRRNFHALHELFETVFTEEETDQFFNVNLPKIIGLALQLPELIRAGIPLLKQGKPHAVSLSQLQIASLLANAFLCTFPWKKEYTTYPGINFNRLYECKLSDDPEIGQKLICILHYFRRVCDKVPTGVLTFERRHLPRTQFPRWDKTEKNISNIKLHISSSGTIENNGLGMLQVDFANSFIGGGVLGYGCVQEEIRFVICPELIVSKLFTEQLASNESLLMIGAERYSEYEGYASSFKWNGNYEDCTPFDEYGRRKTSITAIDAILYHNSSVQFAPSKIIRELNKAYAGFYELHPNNGSPLSPVATGNWGCGAFRGNLHLKALIQIMACTAANRHIVYFTFGDKQLQNDIFNIYNFLAGNNISIVQLWRYICRFAEARIAAKNLLPYIKQSHLDNVSNKSSVIKKSPEQQKLSNNKNVKDNLAIPSTSKQNLKLENSNEQTNSEELKIEDFITDDDEDDIIDSSQNMLELPKVKSPKRTKSETENVKNSKGKFVKKSEPVDLSHYFYSSDEDDSQKEKYEGFLSELDKVNTNKIINKNTSVMDLSSDDLMEVCIDKMDNEETKQVEKSPNKNENSLNRKSLITDYFTMK